MRTEKEVLEFTRALGDYFDRDRFDFGPSLLNRFSRSPYIRVVVDQATSRG